MNINQYTTVWTCILWTITSLEQCIWFLTRCLTFSNCVIVIMCYSIVNNWISFRLDLFRMQLIFLIIISVCLRETNSYFLYSLHVTGAVIASVHIRVLLRSVDCHGYEENFYSNITLLETNQLPMINISQKISTYLLLFFCV